MTNEKVSETPITPAVMVPAAFDSPMAVMARTTPTKFFNDSCNTAELRYAIERGATGATSNPVICLTVLKQESAKWMPVVSELIADHPTWSETQVAWELYRQMGVAGASVLAPVFAQHNNTWGRLSMQTDPSLYNNSEAMLAQTLELASLAPNMQVKMPCTAAGVAMIEEATFRGVSLNVTVSFCVPQVMAIGDAIERGLARRDAAGLDTAHMAPVATMMVGRLDDWLKVVVARDGLAVDDGVLDWAGIACAKRAYGLYQERGFRTTFLVAAYRHLGHWSELVGGDLVHTMPYDWQVKANSSALTPRNTLAQPVDPKVLTQLQSIPEFMRAYEPNGMTVEEFSTFGPTLRTLRSFIQAWHDFVGVVRDVMLPNPD
jgi:transaldolase